MATTFGMPPKRGRNDCDHLGGWVYRNLGSGMAIRYCEGCGATSVLAQLPDSTFALIEVPEHGTEKWADLAVVGEDLPAVQAGDDERPALQQSDEDRRQGPPLQTVSPALERTAAGREEGAA